MKVLFMTLVGLVLFPFFWLLQKLGVLKPPPAVTPQFEALSAHLFRSGISTVPEMCAVPLNNVTEAAAFRLGFNPTQFRVVMVTTSPTPEAAALVESEAAGAPQYTGVRRNACMVMACTFNPPDPALEQAFGKAFASFS